MLVTSGVKHARDINRHKVASKPCFSRCVLTHASRCDASGRRGAHWMRPAHWMRRTVLFSQMKAQGRVPSRICFMFGRVKMAIDRQTGTQRVTHAHTHTHTHAQTHTHTDAHTHTHTHTHLIPLDASFMFVSIFSFQVSLEF